MGLFRHTYTVTSKQQLTGLGRGKGTWMVLLRQTLGSFLFWHSLPSPPYRHSQPGLQEEPLTAWALVVCPL